MDWAPLSLKNLTNALHKVVDWQRLGIQLDIAYHELQKFANEHQTIEKQKQAMLQFWLEKDLKASWKKLLCALGKLDLNCVAKEIEQEYKVPSSTQSEDHPLLVPTATTQSENVSLVDSPSTPPTDQQEKTSAKNITMVNVNPSSTLPTDQLGQTGAREVKDVQLEIKKLVVLYDDLVERTVEAFSEMQENSPNFFRKFRISVAVLPTSLKHQHKYFLEQHSTKIAKATTVEEIFSILNSYWNFLNCSLLAHIISKFGNEGLKKQLRVYTQHLQAFRSQTLIIDFLKVCRENPQLPVSVALKTKMSPEWEHRTLEEAEEYRKAMAQNSSLADYVLSLVKGETGSIYLTWSIPDRAMIGFLVAAMNSPFLERHGVEDVTIDGENLRNYKHQNDHLNLEFKMILQKVDELSEGLVWASQEGCLEEVVFLLSTGVEVNSRGQDDGRTALMWASEQGHFDVVKLLLSNGAQVDLQDEKAQELQVVGNVCEVTKGRTLLVITQNGATAVMMASDEGHGDVVQVLLSSGAQVDLQNKDVETSLMFAVVGDHPDVVQLLLSSGAQVDLQNEHGWTALMYASVDGLSNNAQLLLSSGAQTDLQNKNGRTALMIAIARGHSAIVQLLLSSRAQVDLQDQYGWTALMCAIYHDHTDVVQMLLSIGAQVDLHDKDGRTALIWASDNGHTEVVQLLLGNGAQVDLQDKDGWTALICASANGYTDIVQLLLSSKAHVNLQHEDGWTAVMFASHNGHADVVQLLLSSRALVDIQDVDGLTALMLASASGHTDVVVMLFSSRAQIDIQDKDGWTALMIASASGHRDVVQVFHSSGAQMDQKDKTPDEVVEVFMNL